MAAGSTYTPIATYTVSGTSTTSYTFSSIPSTYTDLVLVVNAGCITSNDDMYMRFNADTGTNYSFNNLSYNGTATSSASLTNQTGIAANWQAALNTGGVYTSYVISIMNYANTSVYKSTVGRAGSGGGVSNPGTDAIVGMWRSTAAINEIKVFPSSRAFYSGSTLTLYGIAAA